MTTFAFDPARAVAALDRMRGAPDGPIALEGVDWAQGAMGCLVRAELLAAQAGVVPQLRLPSGELGVTSIGAARERIDNAPEDVRTIYLATHGIVRSTHATAAVWDGRTPLLEAGEDLDEALGDPTGGIIVALTVIAIAAIVGTAWYLTHKDTIEVEGRNVRTTAIAGDVAELARLQLEKTGKIDPGIWEVFRAIAESERGFNWVPWAIGGGVIAVAAGTFAWWKWGSPASGAALTARGKGATP